MLRFDYQVIIYLERMLIYIMGGISFFVVFIYIYTVCKEWIHGFPLSGLKRLVWMAG